MRTIQLRILLFPIIVAAVVFAPATPAQSVGTFVATGRMTVQRVGGSVTQFRDGRVLFAGGHGNSSNVPALASAEIYDSSTGTFAPTGSMITARYGHTGTLLEDGRVLLAGGFPGAGYALSSAEIYDPSTGRFTATGNMIGAHSGASGILLGNGKVLIAGGGSSAEVYDPVTSVFTSAGNLASSTVALLADGRVLLVGSGFAELYNPETSTVTPTGRPTSNRLVEQATATLLANGMVLIAGGGDFHLCYTSGPFSGGPSETLRHAELYDPSTGTFTETGSLLEPRFGHTATLLPGGKVLVAGGVDSGGDCILAEGLPDAELYDPATGTFTSAGNVADWHDTNSASLLADGTVLLAGGGSAELYFPALSAASSASLTAPLAPESLASIFGARLTASTAAADPQSLPTILGSVSIRVRDSAGVERLAPLLYVSRSQIILEVPDGLAPGNATLEVVNAPTAVPPVVVPIRSPAPGLFTFANNNAAAYAMRIEADGTPTILPAGIPLVLDASPVYLVLFGTGIRNRSSLDKVRCKIGGTDVPVEYAGPTGGGVPGLDQVNIRLTTALKGNTDAHLILTVDGIAANTVLSGYSLR